MIAHATPLADWVVILPVLLCLAGATVLLMLRRQLALQSWVAGLVVLLVVVCDAVLVERVSTAGPLSMTMGKWLAYRIPTGAGRPCLPILITMAGKIFLSPTVSLKTSTISIL